MSTGNLRLAQWLPRDLPIEGDTVAVTQAAPLETEFTTAAFPEAPINGKQYGRQNEGWTLVPPLPFADDAPSDGNRYGRRNAAWSTIPNPEPDAPADGKDYARRNNVWRSLDDYATDAEVAAAIAAGAIPDAPNDGKQYGRQSKGWTLTSPVFEAPTDGKQYARKDSAWAVVAPTNSIAVDDVAPPNPKFGDRWVRPSDGQDATWVPLTAGGGTWIDTDTASMLQSPVLLQDGTLAAPGLAFANELGLGMYRPLAGFMGWASNGQRVVALDGSNPVTTNLLVNPRTTGGAAVNIYNQPAGAANFNSFNLTCTPAGFGLIATGKGGTGVQQPIQFNALSYNFEPPDAGGAAQIFINKTGVSDAIIYGRSAGLNRWAIDLGNAAAESAPQAGSDFGVLRYNNAGAFLDQPISIARATGQATFPNQTNFGTHIVVGSNVQAVGGEMGLFYDGGQQNMFSMGQGLTAQWSWAWNRSSGRLTWYNNALQEAFAIDSSGGVSCRGDVVCGSAFSPPVMLHADAGSHYLGLFSSAYRLELNVSTGTVYLYTNGSGRSYWDLAGQFVHFGQAFKPGGGSWADSSDERIKENIEDYDTGLDAVLALRPRTYNFKAETERDTSITYTGLIAQECETAMPELVTAKPGTAGELEFDDMRTLDSSALIYALVNSVKTLHARIAQLETA